MATTAALTLALALTPSVSAAKPKPHLIMALTDDLGWNYPGYHNPEIISPTLDKLAAEGVRLESHYTYKYCAPTRGSFLTGRFPYHLAATRCNLIPSSIPEGIDLGYTMIPALLATEGYVSHHVGKWHQGFHTPEYTPVGRGFNTSYGFLQGGEDHWTHWCGASAMNCKISGAPSSGKNGAWDLWSQSNEDFPGHPELGMNGTINDTETYSGYIFTQRVVDLVHAHADATAGTGAPMFVYWAIHNTHAPIEAPQRFIDPYAHFNDPRKETFSAMVSVVDESVKNVTDALQAAGMWEDTFFVWTTDNGSPINVGGSNAPLRGGKGHNWEGGVRTPTFVCGGAVGPANRGKLMYGLAAVADWYSTFAALAGVPPRQMASESDRAQSFGLPPPESMDLYEMISGSGVSPRTEIVLDHHMFSPESAKVAGGGSCAGQVPFAIPGVSALGALRQGDWKIIVGIEFASSWWGSFTPNITSWPHGFNRSDSGPVAHCLPACLYNIKQDPGEHVDMAPIEAGVVTKMLARFKDLEKEYHPRVIAPPKLGDAFCAAVNANEGFTAPGWCDYAPKGSDGCPR